MDSKLTKTLVLDNVDFFEEVCHMIHSGRVVVVQSTGWSMLPFIWDRRDVLTIAPLTEDSLKVGNFVLAQLGNHRYVAHRIAEIKLDRITLRGDGNPYQYEYCHRDQIFAEVISVRRGGKVIDKGSCQWKAFEKLWPSNGLLRRVLLFAYRRLFLYHSFFKPKDIM